jgi:cytochrome P450
MPIVTSWLPAGVETYRSLGNLLFGLLSNPDQLEAIREDRSLIPQAIEEAVRWDADRFDIFRQAKVPISWGHGVHVCLGMHLARLEMRTAINLLVDRLPNLRFDPDGDGPHIRGMVFRSPTSLPVLFDPATR